MADEGEETPATSSRLSIEEWLLCAQELVPKALEKAREVTEYLVRWRIIISKLEQIPLTLSNLCIHPCFSKNPLCKEQLQAVCRTLNESIELAILCMKQKYEGKLRMQSDLDALAGKLELHLRDCGLLIKTGVLGEVLIPTSTDPEASVVNGTLREMLARLQIGHLKSKHRALDSLVEAMKEDEKNVLAAITRSNIGALVQLLTNSPRIREKAVTIICSLVDSGSCADWLVSEGVLPPLIRLAESGSAVSKEKAVIVLQRLSISPDTSRSIVEHGGVRPLIEICWNSEPVLQVAATCALKNLSAVPEMHQTLAYEGIIQVMIHLLSHGILIESKESAAECLHNLTLNNDALRRSVIVEGGMESLLAYLFDPSPRESAVSVVGNLVSCISEVDLIHSGLIPRLVHVLKSGSERAQQAAASVICRISGSLEMKRLIGESGCISLLITMLEAKANTTREVAAQAIASLITVTRNCRQVKNDMKSVPNLVALLNPSDQNTAKKHAIFCLVSVSSSRRCKKLMIAYGAIGYLKKLVEMSVPGAENLLKRLERKKLGNLLSRNK